MPEIDKLEYGAAVDFSEVLASVERNAECRKHIPDDKYEKLVKRHLKVQQWAADNLDQPQRDQFFDALAASNYDVAFKLLEDEFFANRCVTFLQRARWTKWHSSFSKWFDPGVI